MKISFFEKTISLGSLYLTISKIFFMISGYITVFILSFLLKPEVYGIYASVTSVLAVLNTIVLNGSLLTVSKIVAQESDSASLILQRSLIIQFFLGLSVSIFYILVAPLIANFLNEPNLTLLFQLSAIIVFCYSIYSIFAGYYNGQKEFLIQALLDCFFSFIKLILVISFALVVVNFSKSFFVSNFDKAFFVLLGSCCASIVIVIIVLSITKRQIQFFNIEKDTLVFFYKYLKLLFPTAALAFLITFILQLDLLVVKKFETLKVTGIYALSIQVARIPYYLVTGIAFALFPIVAKLSKGHQNTEIIKKVRSLIKFYFIIMLFITTYISSNSSKIFELFFSKDYEEGSIILSIYIFSVFIFALFYLLVIAYTACGRPVIACGMSLFLFFLSLIVFFFVIPIFGFIGAPVGSLISNFIGFAIIALLFSKDFGSIIEIKTIAVLIALNGVIFVFSYFLNYEGVAFFILETFFLAGLYSFFIGLSK